MRGVRPSGRDACGASGSPAQASNDEYGYFVIAVWLAGALAAFPNTLANARATLMGQTESAVTKSYWRSTGWSIYLAPPNNTANAAGTRIRLGRSRRTQTYRPLCPGCSCLVLFAQLPPAVF